MSALIKTNSTLDSKADLSALSYLSFEAQTALRGAIAEHLKAEQLVDYKPYLKQYEFHLAGAKYRNRLLRAGNQSGKTYSASAEVSYHLTGEYPDWWEGKRFNRPITCWASSQTGEATRDNCQRMLLGQPKQIGTGMIPKRCLTSIYGLSKGTSGLYDYIYVRHVSGGFSLLKFRYYAQDRKAWQGPPVDVVWWDEEPENDIYEEGLARTIAVKGITILTFTPLLGYTEVVNLYLRDPDPAHSSRHQTQMTLHDVGHLTPEEVEAEIARWPKHQQKARIMGEPAMGVGQIYPYDPDEIEVEPFEIPDHWPKLGAIDIAGGSKSPTAHPTAAVKLAWDRDDDVVYVIAEYRKKGLRPPEHWMRLKWWGKNLRWAWPKDAAAEEKGTGEQVILMYRSEGMNAIKVHAQYPKKKIEGQERSSYKGAPTTTVSVERGIMDIGARLEEGRLRVFSTCPLWFEEMKQYHRDEEGKIVEVMDDLMDATRYGIMMLRFASDGKPIKKFRNRSPDWQAGGF